MKKYIIVFIGVVKNILHKTKVIVKNINCCVKKNLHHFEIYVIK